MQKYAYNSKTGEIIEYTEFGDESDFPRGTWLVYADYITTGFKSRAEAEAWSKEWSACLTCKSVRNGKPGDKCRFCGENLSDPEKGS